MSIILFQFPAACSRVTMTALEEIGLDFEDRCVNLRANGQKAPDYLALNPKGKVPALVIDGRVMTENAAILAFLHQQHPDAELLPHSGDPIADNQGLIDLVWCSGTIHPMVRQIVAPAKWTQGETDGIRADGIDKMAAEATKMARQIGDGWWYGDRWSIIDTYVYWAYSTAMKAGFPLADYPALLAHTERVRARPSFQRVLAREGAAVAAYAIPNVTL